MGDVTGASPGSAIRVRSLSRYFGGLRAVDGISFEVPRGGVFGLLGPNGSGKTTTIRMLLGILPMTAGRAHVLGLDASERGAEIRARSGALFAETGLYDRLTAEDNLELYGRVWNLARAHRRARIRAALDRAGLWERRGDRVGSWSRGMRQRLALARVFLHEPELVFLDEPTQGLDPRVAAETRADVRERIADSRCTVFLTTHNLAEAEELCGTVAVLHRGRIRAVGPPGELRKSVRAGGGTGVTLQVRADDVRPELRARLLERPGVESVSDDAGELEIALAGEAAVPGVVRALVEGGAAIREVRARTRSLEDVYLDLTAEDGA